MFDLENALTVAEYVKRYVSAKLWLCPHLVSNGKVGGNPDYWRGIDCSASTVPQAIRAKKVRRIFRENGVLCIIWQNDEDVSFLREDC